MDSFLANFKRNLETNNIYILENWLQERYELYIKTENDPKTIEKNIQNDIKSTDIEEFIDKQKVGSIQDKISFDVKQSLIKRKVFCQIQAFANIGDATHKQHGNLDEIEKIDNKYLRTDEEEQIKNYEKERFVYKLQLTNGKETFYGFEFEKITSLNNMELNKFQKVIIGDNIEVRRGVLYLKPSNFSIYK